MNYRGFHITRMECGGFHAVRSDDPHCDAWDHTLADLQDGIDDFLEEEAELNGQFGVGA